MTSDRKQLRREAVRLRAVIERGGLSAAQHAAALAEFARVSEQLRASRPTGRGAAS